MGSLSLLQGIFPTQELKQGLLHCRWTLYQLSYQGSPRESYKSFTFCSTKDTFLGGLKPPTFRLMAKHANQLHHREYRSGLQLPSPEDLPDSGRKTASLVSPPLTGMFFTAKPPGKPLYMCNNVRRQIKKFPLITTWIFAKNWSESETCSPLRCRDIKIPSFPYTLIWLKKAYL